MKGTHTQFHTCIPDHHPKEMQYYPHLLNYEISLLQMEGGNKTEEFRNQLRGNNFHFHSETVIYVRGP